MLTATGRALGGRWGEERGRRRGDRTGLKGPACVCAKSEAERGKGGREREGGRGGEKERMTNKRVSEHIHVLPH